MLKTLITKEILEAMISLRFLVASLLCLILIPLGVYVNLKDYEQRLADYQEAVSLSEQRARGRISLDFKTEGYRPPSIFSIFSVGLENVLPNKVTASGSSHVQTSNEVGMNNPHARLFGKLDLMFNVSFVISLLALVFTFSAIAGEKEEGTLKLMMSNPVPRWQILLTKILGNYIVLLAPFLFAILIALIILSMSDVVPLFTAEIWPTLMVIIGVTLLFIFTMFNLGLLVSTRTHRSLTSIVILLFVWTLLILALPRVSPMIAEAIYPVKSEQVLNLERLLVRQNLEKELDAKREELWTELAPQYGIKPNDQRNRRGRDENMQAFMDALSERQKVVEEDYERRINEEGRKLEQDYLRKRDTQSTIAMTLSRISPVSCYTYLMTGLSATGMQEVQKIGESAQILQQDAKENIYDKFVIQRHVAPGGRVSMSGSTVPGFNPREIEVPQLSYQAASLSESLSNGWIDLLLLVVFNVVLFAASHVSFLKYDVR